jgi:cellulose synthase/poly-beta-1,6-N-acetylglucosamine synthase-like glycosyltransferase
LIDSLRVSVVMPAYNEETIIGAILDRVRAVKEVDEIILVDDGSRRQRYGHAQGVHVIRHPIHRQWRGGEMGIRAATAT